MVQLSHPYMTAGKTVALTRWTFVGKILSLLFNMLSGLVIAFLPRIRRLLISWLQSPSAVILEPKKVKSDTVSTVSPSISHEVMEPDAMIFIFWILSFKPTFSLSTFNFIKRLCSSSSLSANWPLNCSWWNLEQCSEARNYEIPLGCFEPLCLLQYFMQPQKMNTLFEMPLFPPSYFLS